MFKLTLIGLVLLLCAFPGWGQEQTDAEPNEALQVGIFFGGIIDGSRGSQEWRGFYDRGILSLDYNLDFVGIGIAAGLSNIGRYDIESPTPEYFLEHWIEVYEGLISFDLDPISLNFGIYKHNDTVRSPYSLFITSYPRPTLNLDLRLESDFFFINTRWIPLNLNSTLAYPDSGANFRTYGLKLGDVRFGLQESIVYLDQYFSPLYFAPIPVQFAQLIASGPGTPNQSAPDPNGLLGPFFEYDSSPLYLYAQFLLDDLIAGVPLKLAWSLGGSYETPVGTFGFYHAGATKYTFQATRTGTLYPYAYYPAGSYPTNTGDKTIWYFENYIGYRYGENNLAFMVTYDYDFGPARTHTELEYTISGNKAPTIPWHGAELYPPTGLLNDPLLEQSIALRTEWRFDPFDAGSPLENVEFIIEGLFGILFNELQLDGVTAFPDLRGPEVLEDNSNLRAFFRPQNGVRLLYGLFIGVQYTFGKQPSRWREKHSIYPVYTQRW